LPRHRRLDLRTHLDSCQGCWSTWNRYRWDQAADSPLLADLRAFLGPRFRPYYDSSRALADEWAATTPTTPAEVWRFFAQSQSYLYNLVIWHASGNRPDYVSAALPHLAGARTILDYGCGIGQDTLDLRQHGFAVTPCDIPSPATTFLRWRLRRERQSPYIATPHRGQALPPADTIWIIDTLDHLDDIEAWLGADLSTVDRVICENLTEQRGHGSQGFHHRRTYDETAVPLAHHGLRPSPTQAMAGPITVFTRRAAAC
jgi:SAM-dependent methyltransferase